jgi:hypothetical protein
VIIGSANSVTATSPQSLNGFTYTFTSWSDGLPQSHQIVAPATNTTYTATYQISTPTGAYRDVVVGDAPIAYWRLGESSGTTAVDQMATHPGTYVGGPTLGVTGALVGDSNTAATLNGTSQNISVASSSAFRFPGTAPFSAEIWFRHTANGTYRRVIGAENASGQGWHIYSQNAAWGFVRSGAGGAAEVTDGAAAGSGWVHAVATYDGTTMRLFENGSEIALPMASSQSLPSDTTFFVGRYGGAPVSMFNGTIDEPAIYSYALSPADIVAHFAAASAQSPTGDPTGLDGTILRVDPATGAGMPGNPFASSTDANARRIIALGLRNPFRITFRPSRRAARCRSPSSSTAAARRIPRGRR